MKILFCDCFSGISGDMFLSAMLDAGFPLAKLKNSIEKIFPPGSFDIHCEKKKKGAIEASYLVIDVLDHALEHHHRHYTDIVEMIQQSKLGTKVKERSLQIFKVLGEAEAKVHGTSIDHVHFHEVGAVDSIIDIVGAACALDYFQIEAMFSSPIPLGSGTVQTDHGLLPVPAPATAELLRVAEALTLPSNANTELVTPTGAAILAAFAKFVQPPMKIRQIGTGSGTKDLPWPNILRVFIGETGEAIPPKVLIETNIDDVNSQVLGYLMQKLFSEGALDVFFTPIYMKKNRPATKVSVITTPELEEKFSRLLIRETSTLGVRVQSLSRYEAERQFAEVETEFGPVPVKIKLLDGEIIQVSPEFEDCARIASQNDMPLQKVFDLVKAAYRQQDSRKADLS